MGRAATPAVPMSEAGCWPGHGKWHPSGKPAGERCHQGKSVPRYLYLQSDPTGTPAEYPCPSRATSVVSRSHHGHNSRLTRDGASMEYLDLTPWRCPEPLIRLKLWLRQANAGQSRPSGWPMPAPGRTFPPICNARVMPSRCRRRQTIPSLCSWWSGPSTTASPSNLRMSPC